MVSRKTVHKDWNHGADVARCTPAIGSSDMKAIHKLTTRTTARGASCSSSHTGHKHATLCAERVVSSCPPPPSVTRRLHKGTLCSSTACTTSFVIAWFRFSPTRSPSFRACGPPQQSKHSHSTGPSTTTRPIRTVSPCGVRPSSRPRPPSVAACSALNPE